MHFVCSLLCVLGMPATTKTQNTQSYSLIKFCFFFAIKISILYIICFASFDSTISLAACGFIMSVECSPSPLAASETN